MKGSFRKEIATSFGGAFLIMFMIGIYFVYIPWNINRLNISESQLGLSIFAFGIANLLLIYEGNGEDLKILKKMIIHHLS